MPTSETAMQVDTLIKQATQEIDSRDLTKAANTLRQASQLWPDEPQLKTLWARLQQEEGQSPFNGLLATYLEHYDVGAGKKLLQHVQTESLTSEDAAKALREVLDASMKDTVSDDITAVLVHRYEGARKQLAVQLQKRPTYVFLHLWQRGEKGLNSITDTLLTPSVWSDLEVRKAAERDIFQLALAQLMDVDLEHSDRAMRTLSRLLASESQNLTGLVDADGFDVILSSLDITQSQELRSYATLATAKLIQACPKTAEKLLAKFIATHVAREKTDDFLVAFSAAAVIFTIAPEMVAPLFLAHGFIENFVPVMIKRHMSKRLELAAMELINAACVDKACRAAIKKHCTDWLQDMVVSKKGEPAGSTAALILVKLDSESDGEQADKVTDTEYDLEQLVSNFKTVLSTATDEGKQSSTEALAYASLRSKVREELAADKNFLSSLVKELGSITSNNMTAYSGLTILVNLTSYQPVETEEQKKMAQLKAYANSTKPSPPDALNDDSHVAVRCKKVLGVGAVPVLVKLAKGASESVLLQIVSILHSLARDQKNRGLMAQQGAVRLLLAIAEGNSTIPSQPNASTSSNQQRDQLSRMAAHALAKILISVNPTHVFPAGSSPITSAIRPLITLLEPDPNDNRDYRDLLPIFESLLALTNLSSTGPEVCDTIVRRTWPKVEDLLLHNNTNIQRAAMELVCNLMISEECVKKVTTDNAAQNRLKIVLALTDVDDLETRKAAVGALAMLTEHQEGVEAVLKSERGVEMLVTGLEGDEDGNEDPAVVHRILVCLSNLLHGPGKLGTTANEKIKAAGGGSGVEILKALATQKSLMSYPDQQGLFAALLEVLQILVV